MALNILAVLLMVLYYCAVVSVGVWSGRKMNADSSVQVTRLSVETRRKQDAAHVLMKLFIANRHLPLWIGVGSMTATWVGGGYLNGTAEAVYRHGILRCHAPLGYAVSLVLGDTAGAIIEVDTRFFILASALVVFFYTSLGGVYVVTHTDVFQIVSMSVCLWICVPFCLRNHAVGQMGPPHSDWVGTIASRDVSQLFDAFLMTALGGIPWQVYFQRVLSCESDFDARMLSYLSAVGCIALAVPPAVIGAVAKSANFTAAGYPGPYHLRDKDVVRVLPYSMRYLTTGFVSMVGLIGITAAIMSSADSSMLSASSMVTKNVYQSIVRPTASDVEVSLVLRIMVFAIGSWATYVALSVNSVFELWLLCSDIVYVLLFPQMISVLYFEDSNTYGAFLAGHAGSSRTWSLLTPP
nr:high-affinity choline transporter 1-like isoform X3 [Dermacentor andersoni]